MDFDPNQLDDLARQLSANVPQSLQAFTSDIEQHLRLTLAGTLNRMDLVTREEFDIQAAVLLRTREKLEQLETIVRKMEQEREQTE